MKDHPNQQQQTQQQQQQQTIRVSPIFNVCKIEFSFFKNLNFFLFFALFSYLIIILKSMMYAGIRLKWPVVNGYHVVIELLINHVINKYKMKNQRQEQKKSGLQKCSSSERVRGACTTYTNNMKKLEKTKNKKLSHICC